MDNTRIIQKARKGERVQSAALCVEHDSAKRFALVREACRDLDQAQADTVVTLNCSPRSMRRRASRELHG